ncbi:hypothetical protein PPACK8108_LOCUS8338 [Phakopsora pachyrhizi]|uniref:Uncharacterized protein n=1 Tax=Phakopsora pachyrhizi TaxID=170000 RepID=A0AAV0AUI5_PHAPC|nr:hypothetical protein PPACK8108_LOCUS8338 [Phakopsora pachyrhizi]
MYSVKVWDIGDEYEQEGRNVHQISSAEMEGPNTSTSYLIVDHQLILVYAIPAVMASVVSTILTAPFDYVKTQLQLKKIKRFSTSSRNTITTTIKSQDKRIVIWNTAERARKLSSVLMEGLRPSSCKAKGANLDVKESRASLKQREIRKIFLIYSIDWKDQCSRLWEIILIGLTLSMHVVVERRFLLNLQGFEEEGGAGQKLGGGAHQGQSGWSKTTGATDL